MPTKIEDETKTNPGKTTTPSGQLNSGDLVPSFGNASDENAESPNKDTEPPKEDEQTPSTLTKTAWPIDGSTLQTYSVDKLSYNATMQDWRTHNGTDLSAREGDSVAAPVSGTVKSVAEDGRWGGVVEIEAQDGALVRLCGVQDVKTAEGQSVEAGAELGTVGEIASESAQDAHIHIEVLQNDEYTDPQLYFSQE